MDIWIPLGKFFKVVITSLPWLVGIVGLHQYLYTKFPKYYFFIAGKFSKWRDTSWDVTCIYTVKKDVDFFGGFDKVIRNEFNGVDRPFNLKNKKLYEFEQFSVTVQYDLNCSQTDNVQVELIFRNINVTRETANNKLEKLRTLFNSLEREIRFEKTMYNMNIKFIKIKNPFYGLMIQRLGEEHVEHFECVFPISVLARKDMNDPEVANYKLRVFKEFISINEKNFDKIEIVAKKCLLLG
ncbi:hypothetical protein IGW_01245 [Bacillus cereus ISP3191]|uniref:hypothetical protein n=1 Tax=Bacillus cereus group TaxID=86661 RepID=UPI0002797210|nr:MULTISPECIES: hypothetical protein [Bacillus cereus group]EJQ96058.1 hypothetical protein IGW_01245 [Bacillus cereus ISP3191]MDR4324008.1 hypothetical protein [Bacillus paranthracis]PGN42279.1 hypothetical protein CN968_14640 [Bacillus thuringiensis]